MYMYMLSALQLSVKWLETTMYMYFAKYKIA